jgi:hypothetical protein
MQRGSQEMRIGVMPEAFHDPVCLMRYIHILPDRTLQFMADNKMRLPSHVRTDQTSFGVEGRRRIEGDRV